MPIDPRQALQHSAEIQSREFAVGSPLQAGEAQAVSVADRSVGVLQGGPPGCRWFKSSPIWVRKKKLLLNNHTSAANLLPEHTLNPWLSIMDEHYS